MKERRDLRQLMAVAEDDRSLLPHVRFRGSLIHHAEPDPDIRAGLIGWKSREDWLEQVVPAVLEAHREVLRQHHLSQALLTRWLEWWTLYADIGTGRNAIWRPVMSKQIGLCSERSDQTCRKICLELGLIVIVVPGRMLRSEERSYVRSQRGRQRGLSHVIDFVIPPDFAAASSNAKTHQKRQGY